jgi:hypothetical protein
MGILPMSITGVPPVSLLLLLLLLLCWLEETEETTDHGQDAHGSMAKMAMLLTGGTPVPRVF